MRVDVDFEAGEPAVVDTAGQDRRVIDILRAARTNVVRLVEGVSRFPAEPRRLKIGLLSDLARRAWSDRYRVAPEMEDRVIRVPPRAAKTARGHG